MSDRTFHHQANTNRTAERSPERQSHVVMNLSSRRLKGLKIERLLNLSHRAQPIRLLEIGTGSGGIAHYFATRATPLCEVDAVDVVDNRLVTDGYRYHHVDGIDLPFPDGTFDVVLTNHVIEHVGDETAQQAHLTELNRVLKRDGVGYVAVPNRWMVVEPHYGLAFLSWCPHSWRTPYLRATRKGAVYDCEPLQMRQLERMLTAAGLEYKNLCIEAWRETFRIERHHSLATRILEATPDFLLRPIRRIIPTLIYLVSRDSSK